MISNGELLLRLILSAIIGGLIGMEREANNRPAGLRTHVLVTLGSTLVMLISMYGFSGMQVQGDPARLAAQVVSGIGFLGAGTILRTGNSIKGLTTAASLWVCGCIGLAIGNGYYLGGLITAGVVLFTLISLGFLEKKIFIQKYKVLVLQAQERTGLIGDIGQLLGSYNVMIKGIKIYGHMDAQEIGEEDEYDEIEKYKGSNTIEIHFVVKIPKNFNSDNFFHDMTHIHGVEYSAWKNGKCPRE